MCDLNTRKEVHGIFNVKKENKGPRSKSSFAKVSKISSKQNGRHLSMNKYSNHIKKTVLTIVSRRKAEDDKIISKKQRAGLKTEKEISYMYAL